MSDQPFPATDANAERIREQERQRIAHDLHDELGSHLTALKMALAQIQQSGSSRAGAEQLQAQTAYADSLVDGALGAMHQIIDDLHPAVLDLGLPAALEWLTQSFARQTGKPHTLLVADNAAALALDTFHAVSLYRIAREALHNAARHAQAQQLSITLRLQPGQAQLQEQLLLEICDDGIGLPPDAEKQTRAFGIRGMQTRAAAMGATLNLMRGMRGGTILQVVLPVAATAARNLIE